MGDCELPSDTGGCSVSSVEQCVCDNDEFCCSGQWDGQCVTRAINECDCVPNLRPIVCDSFVNSSTVGAPSYPGIESGTQLFRLALAERSNVVISTCNEFTNFATQLYVLPDRQTNITDAICVGSTDACDGPQAEITECQLSTETQPYTIIVAGATPEDEGDFLISLFCGDEEN